MLRKIIQKVPIHFKFLVKLYLLSILLFFFIRLFFYWFNEPKDISTVSFFEKIMAFRMGLEFDTVVFGWIGFFAVFYLSISDLLHHRWKFIYQFGYYFFTAFELLYFFICVADIPYYAQFGNHLNKNALLWSDDTGFVIGMIFGSFSYWGFLLLYFGVAFVFIKIANRFYRTFLTQIIENKPANFAYKIIFFVFLGGLITLSARGRTSEVSPTHEGLSIVSQNGFINQIAINPNFTFWKTLLYNKRKKPYIVPVGIDNKIEFTRKYLGIKGPYQPDVSRNIGDTNKLEIKYNFVIVIMESMSVYKMGYYNGKNLTPHLDKLNEESVFFQNFFSSGIHTFNGLFSTTSGYPSIFAEKSMKCYVKKAFDGLGTLIKQQGYENYFYTTQDPHFDNMHGFFTLNKFDHVISQYDFKHSQAESTLGVPDHLLFDKLIETVNNRKTATPFLSVLMTASDHGPWKVPSDISFKPNGGTPQENCTLYADWSIGRFIERVKKQDWYNNTVFIFLGDHGMSMGHTYEMPLSYNHVPCIIHQPKLFKPDTILSPCYQPDIPATVMGIIGADYTNNSFGINILKEKHQFVVFSADDKIGCIDDEGYYFYKTFANNETYLRKYKSLDQNNYKNTMKGRAEIMETNMMNIYESANYLIRKNYFLYE